MCKMRFSDSFYTHEYRPDSGMKPPLNQILRRPTFIYNFLIQLKMEHKMGDRNYCSFETSQFLPEPDTRKISFGATKIKGAQDLSIVSFDCSRCHGGNRHSVQASQPPSTPEKASKARTMCRVCWYAG